MRFLIGFLVIAIVLGQINLRRPPDSLVQGPRLYVASGEVGGGSNFIPASTVVHYQYQFLNQSVVTLTEEEFNRLNNSNLTYELDVRRFPQTTKMLRSSGPFSLPLTPDKRHLQFSLTWGFDAVQADKVHELGIKGQGAKICIIDSGIDVNHYELNRTAFAGYSDLFGFPWDEDSLGHGTHVAGIMAASSPFGIGLRGVAPDAEYFIVRVMGDDVQTTYSSQLVNATFKCVQNGAKIINLSLGGPDPSKIEETLFTLFADEEDILFVAAAGNLGPDADFLYPASYPSVISVSAVDEDKQFADFSNANAFVDLVAPGSEILSIAPNDQYNVLSGTSLATAYVSGVAALLWSHKPDVDASRIRDAMFLGARSIESEVCYGHGLVQAMKSLQILDGSDTPSASPVVSTMPSSNTTECVATPTP